MRKQLSWLKKYRYRKILPKNIFLHIEALLKIIRHCDSAVVDSVFGTLCGLANGSTLEITDSFRVRDDRNSSFKREKSKFLQMFPPLFYNRKLGLSKRKIFECLRKKKKKRMLPLVPKRNFGIPGTRRNTDSKCRNKFKKQTNNFLFVGQVLSKYLELESNGTFLTEK